MKSDENYSIHTDIKYGPLEPFDLQKLISECREQWFNQTLCRVNDCLLRLGILTGEFHWHKHDREDELFYVVDGILFVDLEDKTFELTPQQGIMIPKGVLHRTRAPKRVVILMIEGRTVTATGD